MYKGKYVKKKRIYQKLRLIILLVIILIGLVGFCFLLHWKSATKPKELETTTQPVTKPYESTAPSSESTTGTLEETRQITIEAQYCDLQYSEKYENLIHKEIAEGSKAVEIFSMLVDDTEFELFRIYFGDEFVGEVIGELRTAGTVIPVSYMVSEYTSDDFLSKKVEEEYYSVMDSLSDILVSIQRAPDFVRSGETTATDVAVNTAKYWQVSLPENMGFAETEDHENYQVIYYAEIAGNRIDLFAFSIGNPVFENELGYFLVNGSYQKLTMHNYEIAGTEKWTQQDITELYGMLDSLNTVIQAAISHEYYLESIEEGK